MTKWLRSQIDAASGKKKAEFVLKNALIVNVFTESVEHGDIAIDGGRIVGIGTYEGEAEQDLDHAYVCPGLIDGHVHLESSMVSPAEFERAVLPHGTTAVITDPHEIANVSGIAGIKYMMESTEALDMDVYFMLPSCVPSTVLDESGAQLEAEDLKPLYDRKEVLGLAEMMNSYGVVEGQENYLRKLSDADFKRRAIDGHAPFLSGQKLNAYVAAGVLSDHECSDADEAKEKLARGQWIMIRQGTAAKNLDALLPLFQPPYYQRAMLVTDDSHPGDLIQNGHMDALIRYAIRKGADPIRAIRMATLHPAQYFGLNRTGAVAPGYVADLVVFRDFQEFSIQAVYKAGKIVADHGLFCGKKKVEKTWDQDIEERVFHSFHAHPITMDDLELKEQGSQQRVIDLVKRELITRERIVQWSMQPGYAPGVDVSRDIVKLVILERHRYTGHMGIGFLGNYGLRKGAVATSIGHDSHNLIIAGTNDSDIMIAGNQVIEDEGGLAIAVGGKLVAHLALPIAGLMADAPVEHVEQKLEEMKTYLKTLGISQDIDAFMTLAFVSLPVIPKLRLTTFGVVDVETQKVVNPLF